MRAEVEEGRDVTMYKRNLGSEVVSSGAKPKSSRFQRDNTELTSFLRLDESNLGVVGFIAVPNT